MVKDKIYFYQADTADQITHQLQVDSFKDRKGRDDYYLNEGINKCDTCRGGVLTKLTGDSIFYRVDEPFFWQRRMDYRLGAYRFSGKHDFQVKPYKALDSSWLFRTDADQPGVDSITARIDSTYEVNLFGSTDSVKQIRLSDGRTIQLTKQHGILAFPGFEADVRYKLKGVRSDTSKGKTFAFRSTYDFEPGDVFHYRITDGSKGDNIYLGSEKQIRILDKMLGDTTLTYRVAIATLEKSRVSASDTLFALRRDTTTWHFRPRQELPYDPKGAPAIHDKAHVHPREAVGGATLKDEDPIPGQNFFYYYGCRFSRDAQNRLTKTIGGYKPFNDSVPKYLKQMASDSGAAGLGFYQVKKYVDGYYKKQFKRGLGLTDFYINSDLRESYRIQMTGYVKAGDTVGTVYSDLEAREGRTGRTEHNAPRLHLYPNPVHHSLTIANLSAAQPAKLRLFNQMGQVVQTQTTRGTQTQLNVDELEPGLYILKIEDGEQVRQRKVLKR